MKRIADAFDPALKRMGIRGRVREEQLRELFADVVGPTLAPMCHVVRLEKDVMVISTPNSALAQQLHLESPRIVELLNHRLGDDVIRRLRFTSPR